MPLGWYIDLSTNPRIDLSLYWLSIILAPAKDNTSCEELKDWDLIDYWAFTSHPKRKPSILRTLHGLSIMLELYRSRNRNRIRAVLNGSFQDPLLSGLLLVLTCTQHVCFRLYPLHKYHIESLELRRNFAWNTQGTCSKTVPEHFISSDLPPLFLRSSMHSLSRAKDSLLTSSTASKRVAQRWVCKQRVSG